MVLPEPYFSLSDSWETICPILVLPWTIISLSDSRDTSCAIRFFLEPVPQLRDSWDKHMVLPQTAKTWIQTIYSDSKNKIMYRDTCTMQLQIYIIFEKLCHKMSFKQRLKSSYTMTRFEFSWKMIPESRSRDRKRPITPGPFEVGSFRSDMLLERKLRDGV